MRADRSGSDGNAWNGGCAERWGPATRPKKRQRELQCHIQHEGVLALIRFRTVFKKSTFKGFWIAFSGFLGNNFFWYQRPLRFHHVGRDTLNGLAFLPFHFSQEDHNKGCCVLGGRFFHRKLFRGNFERITARVPSILGK